MDCRSLASRDLDLRISEATSKLHFDERGIPSIDIGSKEDEPTKEQRAYMQWASETVWDRDGESTFSYFRRHVGAGNLPAGPRWATFCTDRVLSVLLEHELPRVCGYYVSVATHNDSTE